VQLITGTGTNITSTTSALDGSCALSAAAGTYKIYSEAPGFAIEYWNNQTTRGAGASIVVTEGGILSGINFTLDLRGTITGIVRRTDNVTPPDSVEQLPRKRSQNRFLFPGALLTLPDCIRSASR